jgi:hypothetical protein
VDFDPGPGLFELTSAGGSDIFVCKLGQDGSFIWAERIGGLSTDISRTLAVDNAGNIIIAGGATGTADLDPGPGVFSSSFGQSFYCKLDADGNFITAGTYATSPGSNAVRSVTTNAAGDIYIIGEFSGTTDFDPGPGQDESVETLPILQMQLRPTSSIMFTLQEASVVRSILIQVLASTIFFPPSVQATFL